MLRSVKFKVLMGLVAISIDASHRVLFQHKVTSGMLAKIQQSLSSTSSFTDIRLLPL